MYFVVTIDTEEDDWGGFDRTAYGVENIKRIPRLQHLFDEFGVTPTYLVTYPLLDHPEAARILDEVQRRCKCEIGMHCHPWNTPPILEERNAFNSMICNLPEELQKRKLERLYRKLKQTLGTKPVCFRAGRWGYGGKAALALEELGCLVDSSVSPWMNWSGVHGPDFSGMTPKPYRFQPPEIRTPRPDGSMIEVPATIDFLRGGAGLCRVMTRFLQRRLPRLLHVEGVFRRLGIFQKVWLSPETADVPEMQALTRRAIRMNYPVVNLFFHSTALLAGLSPFVKNRDEEDRFMNRLKEYLRWVRTQPLTPAVLSKAAVGICAPGPP